MASHDLVCVFQSLSVFISFISMNSKREAVKTMVMKVKHIKICEDGLKPDASLLFDRQDQLYQ